MCTQESRDKDSIARDHGWPSYDDAPNVVQNNIDGQIDGPIIEDPFGFLRRTE